MTTPNDPNLRSGSGSYERTTNAHQRRLLSVYDSWSISTRRLIMVAINQGIPHTQLPAIVRGQLPILTTNLIQAGQIGITAAVRTSIGRQTARTSTVAQTALRNATQVPGTTSISDNARQIPAIPGLLPLEPSSK